MKDQMLETLAERLGEMQELVRQVAGKQQATLEGIESIQRQLAELTKRKGP